MGSSVYNSDESWLDRFIFFASNHLILLTTESKRALSVIRAGGWAKRPHFIIYPPCRQPNIHTLCIANRIPTHTITTYDTHYTPHANQFRKWALLFIRSSLYCLNSEISRGNVMIFNSFCSGCFVSSKDQVEVFWRFCSHSFGL
jgi:hypothetical protein